METVGAVVGASRTYGPLQVDLGVNFVPTDWTGRKDGRTIHSALSVDLGRGFDYDFAIDVGRDYFGDSSLCYTTTVFGEDGLGFRGCARYAFGLGAVDDGAPPTRRVGETVFIKTTPPSNTAFTMTIGVTWTFGD